MANTHETRLGTLRWVRLGLDLGLLGGLVGGLLGAAWFALDFGGWSCAAHHNQRAVERLQWETEMYRIAHDRAPDSLDDLVDAALIDELTADAWGNPYLLVCPNPDQPCGVMSAGPDERFGTADDQRSWD